MTLSDVPTGVSLMPRIVSGTDPTLSVRMNKRKKDSGSGSGGKQADSVCILQQVQEQTHGEQTQAPEKENLKETLAFLS